MSEMLKEQTDFVDELSATETIINKKDKIKNVTYGLMGSPEYCSGFVKLIWMNPNCMSTCLRLSRLR